MQNKRQQNNPTTKLENSLLGSGFKGIIGIDEAGRGSWAGPIAFAAYSYDLQDSVNTNIKDSKLLSASKREGLLSKLPTSRYEYVFIDNDSIDKEGLSTAIYIGIQQLISKFDPISSIFLIDGNYKLDLDVQYRSLIKGDRLHYSISCASIVAKVYRDRLMAEIAKEFPQYKFDINKGYGTKAHYESLLRYGPCRLHRASFKPVKEIIEKNC